MTVVLLLLAVAVLTQTAVAAVWILNPRLRDRLFNQAQRRARIQAARFHAHR